MPNSTKNIDFSYPWPQKVSQFILLLFLIYTSTGCRTLKPTPDKVAERKTERLEKREKRERKKQLKRLTKEHQSKQSENTLAQMEQNKNKAKNWREQHQTKPPFSYRVKRFFKDLFTRDKGPQRGLFEKGVQKRKKKNIFKRIFKRKKKHG